MNKYSYLFTYLVIASLLTPASVSAYYISMDVGTGGLVNYSYPAVLGDDDKPEEKREEKKEEKREEKKEERKEEKPRSVEQRPEKIEIRKIENKPKVKLIKQEKIKQELSPEKVSLKFSAVPKSTPTTTLKKDDDLNESEVENETEDQNEDKKALEKTIRDRSMRKEEKVEIQSEVHDDGTIELQLESRDVKAKIKDNEIEIDIKNNNIGSSNNNGDEKKLIHLPDQALQKFIDRGLSTVPETLEVGGSGKGFEYSIDATKKEKIFGIIPRIAKYKLTLDDQNGLVSEEKVNTSVVDRLLNLFSF